MSTTPFSGLADTGLRSLTRYVQTGKAELDQYQNWRLELEFLINKLCEIHKVNTSEHFDVKLRLLRDRRVISADILQCANFVYKIGHHFAHDLDRPTLPVAVLKNSCRLLLVELFNWYVSRYILPGLSRIDPARGQSILNSIGGLPVDALVRSIRVDGLVSHFELNDLAVFRGNPWVGKTSIARTVAIDLCRKYNAIPIILSEDRVLSSHPAIVTALDSRLAGVEAGDKKDATRLRLTELHRIISSNLSAGISVMLLLDDAFGHRRFVYPNGLNLLDLGLYCDISAQERGAGKVKIIITTPGELWERAVSASTQHRGTMFHRNLVFITSQPNVAHYKPMQSGRRPTRLVAVTKTGQPTPNIFDWNMASFEPEAIREIILAWVKRKGCVWADDSVIVDYVVDESREALVDQAQNTSFRLLNHLVEGIKALEDHDKIMAAVSAMKNRFLSDAETIGSLPLDRRRLLLIALFAQHALMVSRRFIGLSVVYNFFEFAEVFGLSRPAVLAQVADLDQYVYEDIGFERGATDTPIFVHPDTAEVVELYFRGTGAELVREGIRALTAAYVGGNPRVTSPLFFEIVTRYSECMSEDELKSVGRILNEATKGFTVDPIVGLPTILSNLPHVSASFRTILLRYLRRCKEEFKLYSRYIIDELLGHWSLIDEDLREFALSYVGFREGAPPDVDDEHSVRFILSFLPNYVDFLAARSAGSQASATAITQTRTLMAKLVCDKKLRYHKKFGDGLPEERAYSNVDLAAIFARACKDQRTAEHDELLDELQIAADSARITLAFL